MKPASLSTRDSVRHWALPGVEIEHFLCCSRDVRAVERHAHESYQFGLSNTDQAAYRYRGARHRVGPATLSVIQSGETHETYEMGATPAPVRYWIMYVSPALFRRAARELAIKPGSAPFFPDVVVHDQRLVELFLGFHRALLHGSALERDERLLDALHDLLRRFAEPRVVRCEVSAAQAAARRARDYICDHFAHNISLEELANAAGLSASYLCSIFRREYGVAPHQFQIQTRVDRARTLLTTGMRAAEVALGTGFVHQSHFGRHFKRLVGVSPSQYRSAAVEKVGS